MDIVTLVREIVAPAATHTERTRQLIDWMNSRLQWVATDYQRRTPGEIIQRGAGNCADLASVLSLLLKHAGVPHRWVAEIHLQPSDDARRSRAKDLVASKGRSYSVFGYQHNDHRWLEIWEPASSEWIPADPSVGVVGAAQWIQSRVVFGNRTTPAVAAAVPVIASMIAPVAVIVQSQTGPDEDRSQHYLVSAWDNTLNGTLRELPSWNSWRSALARFTPLAAAAFRGELDLHQHEQDIAALAALYQQLAREAGM